MRKLCGLVLFSILCPVAHSQTAADPMAVPNIQFLNCSTGICNPLGGGTVTTYIAGTTTPLSTCASSALTGTACTTPNSNPIQLNSSGFNAAASGNAGIWPLPTRCYKFLLKDSDGNTIWTTDNVCNRAGILQAALAGPNGATLVGFQPTSGTVPLTVASALNSTIIDAGYSTLTLACSNATSAGKTLIVTESWSSTTFTCAAPLQFVAGGEIVPSSSSTVTINPQFYCGTYQQCFDLSASSSLIAFSSSPARINPNWYGADWKGSADSTAALTASLAAAKAAFTTLYIPTGTYKHSGLSVSGGSITIVGDPQQGSVLRYTGSGTAVTIFGAGGGITDIAIRSVAGSADVGLDLQAVSEFNLDGVYIGGAPTSKFTTGLRLRASSGDYNNLTLSWNPTGMLLDLDSSANSQVKIRNSTFFLATNAGIQLADVGDMIFDSNVCEAIQDCILVDNTSSVAVVGGAVLISNNHVSLLTSEDGVTFTEPRFIHIKGANVANAITIGSTIAVSQNTVGAISSLYCNTFAHATTLNPFSNWLFNFSGNVWNGCGTAVNTGDSIFVNILAENETGGGVPLFAGTMYGIDSELLVGGAGIQRTPYYSAYLPLSYVPPMGGTQSAVVNYDVGLQSQVVLCNSTATNDAAALLPSTPSAGQVVTVKKIDAAAHNCIISTQGKSLDGSTSVFNLDQDFGYGTFWYDGTEWWAIAAGAGVH